MSLNQHFDKVLDNDMEKLNFVIKIYSGTALRGFLGATQGGIHSL